MREILFRGKRIDNGKWVYGDLVQNTQDKQTLIIIAETKESVSYKEVDKDTIGQYTSLTDKNVTKIFEGDIVITRYDNGKICSIGDIQFDCGVFGVEWKCHKQNKAMIGASGQRHNLRRLDDDIIDSIEVLGNIYDNPDLLGE